jgi:hypothetical protein
MKARDQESHRVYIETLRRMTPEQRLLKAMELSDLSKQLFTHGLRKRFPDLSGEDFRKKLLERLELCHNRNY